MSTIFAWKPERDSQESKETLEIFKKRHGIYGKGLSSPSRIFKNMKFKKRKLNECRNLWRQI